jgi:hypothetical protein
VVTAGDHNPVAPAEVGGDLICSGRQRRHEADAHYVAFGVEVERLDVLVHNLHVVFARREGGHRCQGQDAEAEHSPARHLGRLTADANLLTGRQDEEDLHRKRARAGERLPGRNRVS